MYGDLTGNKCHILSIKNVCKKKWKGGGNRGRGGGIQDGREGEMIREREGE